MPTATEPSAPKAKAAPAAAKAPAKKPAEKQPAKPAAEKKPADGKKPEAAKTANNNKSKPAEAGKPATPKPANNKSADGKKPAAAADKKPAADKKAPPKQVEVEVEEAPAVPVFVPKLPVTVAALNALELASSAAVLSNLLNMTPSLGFALSHIRPFKSTQHLVDQLNNTLDTLPLSYIETFLKRFNELALLPKSKLTKEHKCCVGLDKLSEEQKAEVTPLYAQYREKFGFPFVVCARETKVAELAVMLRSHLLNDKDQELKSGLKELKKIARMRLLEVVSA